MTHIGKGFLVTYSTARRLGAAMALTALAACSGSGVVEGTPGPDPINPPGGGGIPATFAELDSEFGRLESGFDPAILENFVDDPDGGTVRYSGVVDLDLYSDRATDPVPERLLGEMTMELDLEGVNPVRGSMSNFVNGAEERYVGEISWNGGVLQTYPEPVENLTYSAPLSGTLTGPDGVAWSITDGNLGGNFHGSDATFTSGQVNADICSTISCDGYLGGRYVAAK